MHEMALVRNVVEVVLDECKGKPVKAVKAVHLTIGELSDVVEAYIPSLFQFLARGTIADQAEVVIKRTPLLVRCECGEVFHIDVRDEATWVCPRCSAKQKYHMISGREFRIERVEVEAGEPEAATDLEEAKKARDAAKAAEMATAK